MAGAERRYPFSTGLVTGASSGIGYELVRLLGRNGVRVAAAARREQQLNELAAAVAGDGGQVVVIPADLSKPAEAIRVAAAAEQALGGLELVIANAGTGQHGPVHETPWETLEQIFMVNAVATVALIRAVLPGMMARRSGYIAGISSLASYRGLNGGNVYSASKAALSTFLETLRVETRGCGISVTDVHPGFVRTPMTARYKRKLPFLIEADRAAETILRAIAGKRSVCNFPWQMALVLRIARWLPPALFDRIVTRVNQR